MVQTKAVDKGSQRSEREDLDKTIVENEALRKRCSEEKQERKSETIEAHAMEGKEDEDGEKEDENSEGESEQETNDELRNDRLRSNKRGAIDAITRRTVYLILTEMANYRLIVGLATS
ncbi:uncharacterized protein LOC117225085 [Megalopta genalis]|uniref:uncharacterized protein LOC117225085 n=1 Tax=Megalopta genalis TaxID=115081 RepID=UPI003FD04EBE